MTTQNPAVARPARLPRFAVSDDVRRVATILLLFAVAAVALSAWAPETGSGAGSEVWFGNVALSEAAR